MENKYKEMEEKRTDLENEDLENVAGGQMRGQYPSWDSIRNSDVRVSAEEREREPVRAYDPSEIEEALRKNGLIK